MIEKVLDFLFRICRKPNKTQKYPHPVVIVVPNHENGVALAEKFKLGARAQEVRLVLVEYDEPFNGPPEAGEFFRAQAWFPEGLVLETEAEELANQSLLGFCGGAKCHQVT